MGSKTRTTGKEIFMVCEDESLSQAQLQLFKDYEAAKLKHKTETETYYKTYYDPNKTYPQNVTLSSTGVPGPVTPTVNGVTNASKQVAPAQKKTPPAQTMPRIINVAGSQAQRLSVPNGVPNRIVNVRNTAPVVQTVTSLSPVTQVQQQRNVVQMPAGVQGAMPHMVNINGQNIRLLVTPQMQSQIQSGARLVFNTGNTTATTMTPVRANSNTSGPRIMYTTTGQRVIQPPTPQSNTLATTTQAQRNQQAAAAIAKQVAQAQAAKRPATNAAASPSAAKRQKTSDPRDGHKEKEHYGFKKGKKKFDDDNTSQPKFSCHHCKRRIASNVRFMQHIKNHLEKERQHTFSLNDMINCEHCYKRFRTPFERQCHIEKFHMKTDHTCGVCELSFENSRTLVQHLEEKHPALQMPYICKICDYRTSVYDDIIVHFSKTHLGSKSLLCHFCLRIVKTAKDFSRHCLKHLTISIRNGSHRCKSCKLMFLSYSELKEHSDKDHVRFAKSKKDGIPPKNASKTMAVPAASTSNTSPRPSATATPATSAATSAANTAGRTLTVRMPAFNKKPQTPFLEYKNLFRPYDLVKPTGPVWCCECGARVFDPKVHFKKHNQCTKCSFTTFCGETYANHMIVFHSARKPPTTHPVIKAVRQNGRIVLKCKRCDFNTKVPSMMAWHVASACTGGISFMSFQRMIYPAKEKENDKEKEAEEIVILSDEETEPVKATPSKKSPVKPVVDSAAKKAINSAKRANNNSNAGTAIGSALAELEGTPVQVNGKG